MIKLLFGLEDAARCRFACSPLWETLAAVRTLIDPRQQPYHAPWLRRAEPQAAALDLSLLHSLQPTRGYVPDFLTPPPQRRLEAFTPELARVRRTPLEHVRAELARSFDDRPPEERVTDAASILSDPAGALDRLARELEGAWRALVEPYWPAVRELLDDDVRFHARLLAHAGMERLFAELHPQVHWRAGCLTIRSRASDERDLAGAGLVLMPSAFIWPTVTVIVDPPWQPTLVYPARGVDGLWADALAAPLDSLVRLLGRSRALLLVDLEQASSTTALARRQALSPATVSEHLATLRDAGLVQARREGHEVLYRRTVLGDALATQGGG